MSIHFDNSFSRLPAQFFSPQNPTKVTAPQPVRYNSKLAKKMGIPEGELTLNMLAGNDIPDGATPIATAYSGHQFGGFSPRLGDGRAILLGEVVNNSGTRFDLQLKGSGPTMYSRNGDGRANIGAVIREYVVSEAMHALGIPTTRALAAVTTGENVQRETATPGAVLMRVASSHIRVGTFQFHYARRDVEALQALTDHVIARHYPDADGPIAMLNQVIEKQANLITQWMGVGFVHGVMNTDNMAISGETIDYGPCAFLEGYHPDTVFSSIDRQGRYAFANQPKLALWNLAQLAQSLALLVGEAGIPDLQAALDGFDKLFDKAFFDVFRRKLGLHGQRTMDEDLIKNLMHIMAAEQIDFTLFFSRLAQNHTKLSSMFDDPTALKDWLQQWQNRLGPRGADFETMRISNPVYIPRNHRVEAVIEAANVGDYAPFETLMQVLENPFERRAEFDSFEAPAQPDEVVHATFCGT